MTFGVAQSVDLGVVLVGTVMAALLITVAVLGLRGRRRRARIDLEPSRQEVEPVGIAQLSPLDGAALTAAVCEAESAGQLRRLPGLYLSLARLRLEGGETAAAEDLLRKSIRGATTVGLKDTHAEARLALGDISQAGGDLATACEHWQIARALFLELRQSREHHAVETRMRSNGCPTDWVLTDF
jgi:hypothetical protein